MAVGTLLSICMAAVTADQGAAQERCFGIPIEVYAAGDNPAGITAGDLDGDGAIDLAVTNIDSNEVSVLLNLGDGTFGEEVRYPAGDGASSVTVGDVNGDGALDLAVANRNSHDVSVLLNQGDETFDTQHRYAAGNGPNSVAVGDLDGDGALDLAVSGYSSDEISVLRNRGGGIFADDVRYAVGYGPASVAVGDLDGNGSLDLAVANRNSNDVSILLNAGNGTFVKQTRLVTDSPSAVAIGDLDGDGALDLVVTNALFDPCCFEIFGTCFDDYIAGTVSVFINAGDGTFPEQAGYATAKHPASVTLGDVTGDGALDVVLANVGINPDVAYCGDEDNGASVFRNLGDGTLADEVRYEVGEYSPTAVIVGDLDGDGALDVALAALGFYENATADWEDAGVFVLPNLGNGTFGTETRYAPDTRPDAIAAGDFDGDGALDLVIANGMLDGVSVFPNLGDGTFADDIRYAVGVGPASVAVGDLDGDGALDLAVANGGGDVSVLRNLGDGTFGDDIRYAVGVGPASVALGDLDGNGSLDLAVANESSNDVSVLLNVCSPPCPADLDGDGAVGFVDLAALLSVWGPCIDCPTDLDGSDGVGFGDLTILLNAWGPC